MSKTSSKNCLQCFPKLKWIKKVVSAEAEIEGVSESKIIGAIFESYYFRYDSERLEYLKNYKKKSEE